MSSEHWDTEHWDTEHDVVVVGVGAAGASAALAAHQAGATVLVVDKGEESTAGGNTRVSGGGWFINTDPDRAEVFLRALSEGYPVADDVVRTWAAETAQNSTWLRSLGADVAPSGQYHVEAEFAHLDGADCYGGMDTVGGRMGSFLLYDFLRAALAERGIEVRLQTCALELVTDADGVVTGLVVETGGARQRLRARGGVVLATGGFAANPAMVRDYLRLQDPPRWGTPLATGDGHRMAQRVGADLWHMDNMMTVPGVDTGDGAGLFLALWAAKSYLFVAPDGRRFTNEAAPTRHGHVQRNGADELFPLSPFHVVLDERMRLAGPISPSLETLPVGWRVLMDGYRWSADNSAEIDKGWVHRADTVAALAAQIGVDPETLERTVAGYNAACAAGRDDYFGRPADGLAPLGPGPYYAVTAAPMIGWSNGGPRRDGRARVTGVDGEPIAGLYAAGEVSSTYSWRKDGGFHVADAMAFGRVAGREAAGLS